MIEEQENIVLGGVKFIAQALTFDQLQQVLPAIAAQADKSLTMAERLTHAQTAVSAAIGKTEAEFGALPMKVPEILAALRVVSRITGLEEMGNPTAAQAEAKA